MLLSWHVQNFVVIGQIGYEQKHYKICLNFELDQNIVNGTGTMAEQIGKLGGRVWGRPILTGQKKSGQTYISPARLIPMRQQHKKIKYSQMTINWNSCNVSNTVIRKAMENFEGRL